ncbi:hypothetical protein [Myxococcus xanthus]|uniref:Uncharacterized protein n=1 Tax=Myxococcus xanthus TaxID=34 RepID=A0AAE6KRM7_MYXXA|nr:hypothetical protein [Myxococcus xanthus]QDE67314.1 hypothetical protein BHS09_10105 [Myxococcus xanthus]QDE74589.1 hypothetical protein BHS08_10115 [Myxococcus xanthus]QDE96176.1 hypothetical protein BHS05_10130 [Myxococcus xanthus]
MFNFLYYFALWLALTSAGVLLLFALIAVENRGRDKERKALLESLRCVACGGESAPDSIWESGSYPMRRGIPQPPPEVEMTCATCGLVAIHTDKGEFVRVGSFGPSGD